tara:strand:+ start:157 stop:600 length:444 start_codon:yes stop_codon:yes gene_type:complete
MEIKTSLWYEFSMALERGPLVYALGIKGEEKVRDRGDGFKEYTEVYPKEPWNFGLIKQELDQLPNSVKIVEKEWDGRYPWNLDNAPITLKIIGLSVPEWKAVNGIPYLPSFWGTYSGDTKDRIQELTLVPYGCTTLRISQFPAYTLP